MRRLFGQAGFDVMHASGRCATPTRLAYLLHLVPLPRRSQAAAAPASAADSLGPVAADRAAWQPLPDRAPARAMKALVTGAGGFVGANLVRCLLAGGHEPSAAVRPGWHHVAAGRDLERRAGRFAARSSRPGRASSGLWRPPADVDLSSRRPWRLLVAERSRRDARRQRPCDRGTARSPRATWGHRSSMPAPPRNTATRTTRPRENERVEPNSHYAVTKVAATHLCRLAAATSGVQAVTLRLYSIYGPWEEPGRLMPTLVQRA